MEKFMKMLEKKKKGSSKLGDLEKEAKMKALGDLKSMAEDDMGEKVKGLKKVSVVSDSKKGLAMGLDKAEEMVGDDQEAQMLEHEDEGREENEEYYENCTPEEIDAKLEKLLAMKEKLSKK